ncbi:multiheme c-type cytochrome [Aurantiacibacter sp. MUD11]|uniref:multiheme c-type cytochrome n=1 Tax=Aurantiacibacter sp. MUD11 TaxID=3003265 RepID=UPI0022AA00CA|nr:multiheme c-type cytochrome [Aurantiacibacter sp. MUD11]WAT16828.1 multiheme c-type cytochrome [Aurantiacibacter sp. MUD11]
MGSRVRSAIDGMRHAVARHAKRVLPALGITSGAIAAVALGLTGSEPLQAQNSYSFTGVASCAGSTCHGRSEGNGAIVRQDEIATWQSPSAVSGAHSRAYNVLHNRRGRQIVASLGYNAQQEAENCYGCHATFAPVSQRGPKFQLDDGVGCESCHGAAIGWIDSHYEVQGTHPNNVRNGLTPLEQPQERARVCLDCHYGSTDRGQFVTHAMMAAGHPRITFELDLFSSFQQHHDVDDDYVQRKGRPDSVRLWAVGQAEAVARATDLFARPDYGTEGVFPQLYFYDCHSCHRAITDGPDRRLTFETNPARPITFGQPPFNDENIIMLSSVADALAPSRAEAFRSAARGFHDAMDQGRPEAQAAAIALRTEALALSNALAARSFGNNDAFAVIERIGSDATAPRFTDYAGSVQAVMAVDTLLNAMVSDGRVTLGAAAGIRANINRAYAAVASPGGYRPAAFREALGSAVNAIGRLR